ncbi:MAG: 3-dehydroquinate synthase [Actinobacteria bacterium]|nr:MAG: 3-dehydroquinate synthase [Actinomycetota bacterium]
MEKFEKTIYVSLGDRSYPIHIGVDNLSTIGQKLRLHNFGGRVVIISNPEVLSLYKSTIDKSIISAGLSLEVIEVASGEETKSLDNANDIYEKLLKLNVDRYTPIIAFGGGVVGDLAGFVAATYMRGTPYIQIPTTLLAQVDSSVGGKVAVNHPMAKNIIGCFYQPRFVLADVLSLKSLPEKEYVSGLAEVIKYSFIADNQFLEYLDENIGKLVDKAEDVLIEIVKRCCLIKAKIVEADERDQGLRAVLNLGHTVGHALESLSQYHKYLHGEAIAVGLLASAHISQLKGYIDKSLVEKTKNLLERANLPTKIEGISVNDIIQKMALDKKAISGKVRFVLVKAPGETVVENVESKLVEEALKEISING